MADAETAASVHADVLSFTTTAAAAEQQRQTRSSLLSPERVGGRSRYRGTARAWARQLCREQDGLVVEHIRQYARGPLPNGAPRHECSGRVLPPGGIQLLRAIKALCCGGGGVDGSRRRQWQTAAEFCDVLNDNRCRCEQGDCRPGYCHLAHCGPRGWRKGGWLGAQITPADVHSLWQKMAAEDRRAAGLWAGSVGGIRFFCLAETRPACQPQDDPTAVRRANDINELAAARAAAAAASEGAEDSTNADATEPRQRDYPYGRDPYDAERKSLFKGNYGRFLLDESRQLLAQIRPTMPPYMEGCFAEIIIMCHNFYNNECVGSSPVRGLTLLKDLRANLQRVQPVRGALPAAYRFLYPDTGAPVDPAHEATLRICDLFSIPLTCSMFSKAASGRVQRPQYKLVLKPILAPFLKKKKKKKKKQAAITRRRVGEDDEATTHQKEEAAGHPQHSRHLPIEWIDCLDGEDQADKLNFAVQMMNRPDTHKRVARQKQCLDDELARLTRQLSVAKLQNRGLGVRGLLRLDPPRRASSPSWGLCEQEPTQYRLGRSALSHSRQHWLDGLARATRAVAPPHDARCGQQREAPHHHPRAWR